MNKNDYAPKGYNTVMPALAFKGTDAAIKWYVNIFNAKEKMRMENPDKTIGHAEILIGDSLLFLSEENPQFNKTPKITGGNSISLYVYMPDVDAVIKKAKDNGAKITMEAEDMFYGDRVGHLEDPFGYEWTIATHVKEVSEKEMQQKMKEMQQQMPEMHHN
jgi:PhnB protein